MKGVPKISSVAQLVKEVRSSRGGFNPYDCLPTNMLVKPALQKATDKKIGFKNKIHHSNVSIKLIFSLFLPTDLELMLGLEKD